jgi:cell division septum initiation protein DivIVA
MEPIFEGRNHMYKVEKKNRILRIPDEKFDEYKKMGYIIRDENDNILFEPENIKATAEKLKKENDELKTKLKEVTLYAEDADKKITDLQKENEELKAAIQAQATMGSAAPVSEDSGKKKTTKTPKQSE